MATQVIVWRLRVPRNQTLCLLLNFALVPLLLDAAAGAVQPSARLQFPFAKEMPGIALSCQVAVGCHLITYAGVEGTSPSLMTIRALEAAARDSRTRRDLARLVTEWHLVVPRLRALNRQQIIAETAEGNHLTATSILIAKSAALNSGDFLIDESV
jgi:hypothetical protein